MIVAVTLALTLGSVIFMAHELVKLGYWVEAP